MKYFKKFISITIALLMALSGNITAYADEGNANCANSIQYDYISAEELEMNSLEEKGKNKIALFTDGSTDFDIVIPDDASAILADSAAVLEGALNEMTGGNIKTVSFSSADASKGNIYINIRGYGDYQPESDATDGYRFIIDEKNIIICSSTEQGAAYGVYSFIEDSLGCMFLTPQDTYIPHHKSIYLEKADVTSHPATQWRDVYAYETAENKWGARLRLNGIDSQADNGKDIERLQYEGWGSWCHNCYDYLSPEDYFDTHPEYFSEKDGERITEYGGREAYLCLSNPEVFEIVKSSLAEKIKKNPDKMYWDFSGNDNPALAGCECEKCKALDEAAGGTGMGTLLPFLNKLARAFPDKYISTLAYLHTLPAPKNIKAEPNVVIKLCSMPGDQASSYNGGLNDNSAQFKKQVEAWSKITNRIVVWDYVVNFAHLLLPFPNFAVQAENQKFYENNNIVGIFHQASREKGGELACMRAYVLSHLMWEGSKADVSRYISKYTTAYFGDAAPKVLEYFNLCAQQLSGNDSTLGLYDGLMAHYDGYLSRENIEQYFSLIDEAKQLVKGNEVYENRVEEIELSLVYAKTLIPEIKKEERSDAVSRLKGLCEKHEISMVCEWESLENFTNDTLSQTVREEKKELYRPYITAAKITAGVAAAVVATGIILFFKKRKSKAKL